MSSSAARASLQLLWQEDHLPPPAGAGQRSAVIYSVLRSCRRLGINPAEYLKDVFEHLPKAKTSEVKSLIPAAWFSAKRKAARQP
jgi:hypothetical protein